MIKKQKKKTKRLKRLDLCLKSLKPYTNCITCPIIMRHMIPPNQAIYRVEILSPIHMGDLIQFPPSTFCELITKPADYFKWSLYQVNPFRLQVY